MGHWGEGMEHVQADRRCSWGQKRRSEHSQHQAAGGPEAICDHEGFAHNGPRIPPNLRSQETLENGFAGPFGPRTRVRKSFDGAMGGGGPKQSANRGASGYGARSLVERLNQTVSIHLDMTDAPTHHIPDIHGFRLRVVKRLARPRSPPRPTANDPSRADLRGQS